MKKKCIILRSGSEFWISQEGAEKLEKEIISQERHQMLKIKEIDRVINTADIVEILTAEQMDERQRIKNKEFKCSFGKWHTRGERCDCQIEANKKKRREQEDREREESMKPQTPEQQEATQKALAKMRKELEDKGILIAKKMTINHEPETN